MTTKNALIIEDGIPLPSGRTGSTTDQLRNMQIGQSFLVAVEDRQKFFCLSRRVGISIATRQIDKSTIRVWRVEGKVKVAK